MYEFNDGKRPNYGIEFGGLDMKEIFGGVCAPIGYKANGIHCGIRKNRDKRDLMLLVSEKKAAAAGVYTLNLVKGAPIIVTQENIKDGYAQGIICNSGNANTCNADGIEIAEKMCQLVEQVSGGEISSQDVIVASTGIIGEKLDISPIENGMKELYQGLGANSKPASEAIMTTDLVPKEIAISFQINGKECHIGGIAKGSGMIKPNMATMLVFLTSDVNITPEMLKKALDTDVKHSFNMISVDGDTSTNDMYMILANGCAENPIIDKEGEDYEKFLEALRYVSLKLSKEIAGDGEGATKLIEATVSGANDYEGAAQIAKSIISSSLVKTAMFGEDANWGRVLCAIGYSGINVDVSKVEVEFQSSAGCVKVCKKGAGIDFSEEIAKKVLKEKEIKISASVGNGAASATAFGCDLSYEYVRINGDYRT